MFNAQSARNKLHIISDLLSTSSYQLFFITETFFKKETNTDASIIGNSPYIILRNDRLIKAGGGVAILIYSKLHYIPINHNYPNVIAVDIIQNQTSSTRYILIYRPPSSKNFNKSQSTKLFDNVREIINMPSIFPVKNTILLGDFNYPNIEWDSDLSTQSGDASPLIDLILEKQLHQHVKEPTRLNNILDLIFSTNPESVMDIKITDPIGDHNVILFKTSNEYTLIPEKHDYKDFKNGDYDGLNNHFNSINWESELKNIHFTNDKFEFIRDKIIFGISNFIPTKTYDPTKNIPPNLQNSMNFYKKFSSNPSKTTVINQSIKKLNKEYLKFTKNRQRKLFLKKVQNSDVERKNVKNLFNYVSPFLKQKTSNIPVFLSNGVAAITDKEKADALGQFYAAAHNPFSPPETDYLEVINSTLNSIIFNEYEISKMLKKCSSKNENGVDNISGYALNQCAESLCKPLKILFNCMMESPDDIPNLFLLSYVTPIPKIPKPLSVENFRPISGTSDILKTMERCIKIVMVRFLENKNYFPKQQYGFRSKMSTIKQLIPFQEFIISNVSKKMTVDVIYFDWEKAFDKIPICRLIRALKNAGINGNLLKLITTLLSFRKFKVKVGKEFSETFNATSGVPQGSVLGPLLFIIFISELSGILSNLPGIQHLLFADDLKIYFAYFKNQFDISIIQNAINAIFNWSTENSMTTSTSKTFHMQYGTKNEEAKYLINDVPISTVTIVRDLGIMLHNNLQPHTHIKKIVGSAMASMFTIIKRVLISSSDVLIFLFNVYVRPILEYGTQLFNVQQKTIANYLERPQKLFTRILYRRQHKFGVIPSYPSRLKLYNLKSLHERRNIIDLETAFEYLHTNLPNESSLQFNPTYNTRFKKAYKTTQKLTNKYRLCHFSSRTWHFLNNIKNVNISNFTKKKEFKQYLSNNQIENYYS